MITKLNLEVEANKLADKVEGKAYLDTKFGNEYTITEVTEDTLLEEGYKFIGNSSYTNFPMYQKENISGIFVGNAFRLSEGLMTTEEELRKEEENEKESE